MQDDIHNLFRLRFRWASLAPGLTGYLAWFGHDMSSTFPAYLYASTIWLYEYLLQGWGGGRIEGGGCSEIEAPALSIITTKIFLQAQLSSHFPQSFTLNHLGVQVSAVRPRQPCLCPPSLPLPLSAHYLPRRAAVTTMRPVEARKHLRILQISKATAAAAAPHLPLLCSPCSSRSLFPLLALAWRPPLIHFAAR